MHIPRGSIRATVLIETIPAAFEMDEILYALREHSAGLNCGRWDYIFSIIKKFHKHAAFTMPDRGQVGMTAHCMRCYSLLAIKTCHRRGIHAIGGMAAQIPNRRDAAANEAALEKVRADKVREADDGHDGTWVAHPGLVALARDAFDARMPLANQISRRRDDVQVTAKDLLTVPQGEITEAGLAQNIDVGVQYMAAWLAGNGCVPLYNLMEDAATAEISRAQLWQWLHQPNGVLSDGRKITAELAPRGLPHADGPPAADGRGGGLRARDLRSGKEADRDDCLQGRVHRVHDARGIRAFGLSLAPHDGGAAGSKEGIMGECGAWELEQSWKVDDRWVEVNRPYTGRRRGAAAGQREDRAHAGPPGGGTLVEAAADGALRPHAGGPDRGPGRGNGAGGAEGHLRQRLAGGR